MTFLMLSSAHGVSAQKNGYGAQNGSNNGYGNPDGYDLAAIDFLTEARIPRARPKERPYMLRDGGGLYLLDHPDRCEAVAASLCDWRPRVPAQLGHLPRNLTQSRA
jgi:hypothetical protein